MRVDNSAEKWYQVIPLTKAPARRVPSVDSARNEERDVQRCCALLKNAFLDESL